MIHPSEIGTVKIDGNRYFDRSVIRIEVEQIWRKIWLLAALESDLRVSNSLVVFDIRHDGIIIARAKDGSLLAYHKACTHRGTKLLEEGAGQAGQIACPYHAWCFDLDGSLQLNPDPALGGDPDQKQTLHGVSQNPGEENGRVLRDCFGYEEVLSGDKSMTITIDQDISLLARVQAGAQSSGFESAWLCDQEISVAHFHDTLNSAYRAADTI